MARTFSNVTSLKSSVVTSVSSGCSSRYNSRAYSGWLNRYVKTLSLTARFNSGIDITSFFNYSICRKTKQEKTS